VALAGLGLGYGCFFLLFDFSYCGDGAVVPIVLIVASIAFFALDFVCMVQISLEKSAGVPEQSAPAPANRSVS
jgi:hypothetical protein